MNGRWLIPAGALVSLLPWTGSAAALLLGAAIAIVAGNPWAATTRGIQKKLLPASVVGLGAAMNLGVVLRTGMQGFAETIASITFTLALGLLLARWLRVAGNTGTLISVGTAICGGSAIAAAGPVLRAEEHEMTVSLGTVFILNGIALVAFPPIGRLAGLGQEAFGTWAALAIHDTSSVVGAGLAYGPRALEVGTTVKLVRALWIVPLVLALGAWHRRGGGEGAAAAPRPWFILGFLAMAAVVTWVPALQPAGRVVAAVARQALVLTLFLVGAGLSRDALRRVGVRPFLLGSLLWVIVAVVMLAAVRWGHGHG
ncbi:MAG TPA: putative sulfate exporter family transporter [Anaeromyxobacteraceae bacterium]|nr:putative sulfate exporter family transporter [Anaeromyxobacteraceae bacterium]